MSEFLEEVRSYFQRYSAPTIRAFGNIRALDKPDWAKAACFWLQHDDGFRESLPICFSWIDDEGGIATVKDDPLFEIKTEPWHYGESTSWPQFEQKHGWRSEDFMRLTICHWVRDCWNRSGSDSFPVPITIHDQAQCNDYSFALGHFFTSEENLAKRMGTSR